ncbi:MULTISPECIES: cutinase family protein [Mycolicibacterium]|uniref:Cutinase n=1 Tax=Mycolicibacterium elephantis TaxID=81858 RepID=A0A0M2ZJF7_9MYCO|nr:cutinase family protein [Mycolicibacterium elephantis]KKW65647.1 cutinase [Mycolicibacterium elephantis]OBA81211.1 cutinase [Mycolicibacterium elephantis]OBB25401.1 cutinase [Mycolicibacterium elephantis]ORA63723.1 cutinase family protein [Mycolicibacterium elephantis]
MSSVIIGWVKNDLGSRCGRRGLLLVAAVVLAAAGLIAPATPGYQGFAGFVPVAAAQSCPQAELIFARGRTESPGAGVIGNALISAIRSKTDKSINLYSVNYPADYEVDIGANDMSARIQDMATRCPDTRLVLGGYSLGAAVTDVVLAAPIAALGFKNPLPAGMDRHIAAIALFGNGIAWVGPITNFSPLYGERTIELCHGADPICSPADPKTWEGNWPDHAARAYINAGMVNQAADFIVARL